jgi:hypothetical protein
MSNIRQNSFQSCHCVLNLTFQLEFAIFLQNFKRNYNMTYFLNLCRYFVNYSKSGLRYRLSWKYVLFYFQSGIVSEIYTVIKNFGFPLAKHSRRQLLRKFQVQKIYPKLLVFASKLPNLEPKLRFSDRNLGF